MLVASCSASLYGAVSSQYHNQDLLGQYAYGYADPNSQKHESRSANGITHGGYSYVDGNGLVQSVEYTADPVHGFRVAGTNLPVGPAPAAHSVALVHAAAPAISYAHHSVAPIALAHAAPWAYAAPWGHGVPQDTPEVAAAKVAHFAAHAQARANHHLHKRSIWGASPWAHAQAVPVIHNGVPVDTPEVQHAKAAHFAAHAAANHGIAPAHYAAGHYAVPVIHNGVPVDTPEVQHAKAAHFAAVAEAQSRSHSAAAHYAPAHYAPAAYASYHSGPIHIPVIQNGVPVETPEVQHAKAAHYAALAEAQSRSGHYDSWNHHDW